MQANQQGQWHTVQDVAKLLSIPRPSVARYIQDFRDFLDVKKYGNKNVIHSDSIKIIKKIRDMYDKQKSTEEIREKLSATAPVIIDVTSESSEVNSIPTDDMLFKIEENLSKKIDDITENIVKQMNDRLGTLEMLILQGDEKAQVRDKMLLETMRHMQEVKRLQLELKSAETEAATSLQNEHTKKKKRWWQFWKTE